MYTVTYSHLATGEGITHMVLYTKGYGSNADPKQNALDLFKKHFGEYLTQGAEVTTGMLFDFPGSDLLVSESLKKNLYELSLQAGGLEYQASMHINLG